jgi:hypothetical protein
VLELLALVLATPGAIAALQELRLFGGIARATPRPHSSELDFSVHVRIRRR